MTWMTLEQFKSFGKPCCMCEKTATWIPMRSDGDQLSYCDDHYPIIRERKWITKEEAKKIWPEN